MPGMVNTGIVENSRYALGLPECEQLSDAELLEQIPEAGRAALVGEEAKMLDEQVRANPEAPFNYDNYAEMYAPLIAQGEASGAQEP
jgi:hypothetical protein